MAGMMEEKEGMVGSVWRISGDGFVGSVLCGK
jgi:hypothetical protein